jgi:hypothetical protein
MKENFERANDPSQSDTVRAAAMHAAEHMKKEIEKYKGGSSKPEEKPKTPDELLERQAETGTHSILDITTISNTPDFSAISPLPRERLAEVFGTESPTRSQIEKAYKAGVLEEFISERWQGIYIIAFRDGTPSEIFFAGCSGD